MSLPAQAGEVTLCPIPLRLALTAILCLLIFSPASAQVSPKTATNNSASPAKAASAFSPFAGINALTSPSNTVQLVGPLSLEKLTNPVVIALASNGTVAFNLVTNAIAADILRFFATTNNLPKNAMSKEELIVHLTQCLETARYLRNTRQPDEAAPLLMEALDVRAPESLQQSAVLELAGVAQDQNKLPRAQQIYSQFLTQWPKDLRAPEILLRQGILFRQMGMYNLAFTKFYAVMTSALVLKNDQLEYYIQLVLQAQTQIAETQYELGKYSDAAEYFTRLLNQSNPSLDKSQITYKLVRCLIALSNYDEAVAHSQDFLARYPEAPEQAEVRFHLAQALKKIGRNNESLQQVLILLREQQARIGNQPLVWSYWQQRAGNLIANQLYQEGDYGKALEVYLNLAQIDPSAKWQVPVLYQIGITYERLWQPQKAAETYTNILAREKELGADTSPELKTMFEMTRWRIHFLQWQEKAEAANRQLRTQRLSNKPAPTSLSAIQSSNP